MFSLAQNSCYHRFIHTDRVGEICKSNLLFEAGLNSDQVASDFLQSWKPLRKGGDFPYLSWPLLHCSVILSVISGLFASFYQSEFHLLIYGHSFSSSHAAHQQGAWLFFVFFITSLYELAGCCCCCAPLQAFSPSSQLLLWGCALQPPEHPSGPLLNLLHFTGVSYCGSRTVPFSFVVALNLAQSESSSIGHR